VIFDYFKRSGIFLLGLIEFSCGTSKITEGISCPTGYSKRSNKALELTALTNARQSTGVNRKRDKLQPTLAKTPSLSVLLFIHGRLAIFSKILNMDSTDSKHKTRFVPTQVSTDDSFQVQTVGLVQPGGIRKRPADGVARNHSGSSTPQEE